MNECVPAYLLGNLFVIHKNDEGDKNGLIFSSKECYLKLLHQEQQKAFVELDLLLFRIEHKLRTTNYLPEPSQQMTLIIRKEVKVHSLFQGTATQWNVIPINHLYGHVAEHELSILIECFHVTIEKDKGLIV